MKPGDNLFEIETDKVSMEVPATEAGVLSEIRVSEGEVAPVGAVVGVIGDAGAGTAAPAAKAETPKHCGGAGRRAAGFGACLDACPNAPAADQARSVLRGAHARA